MQVRKTPVFISLILALALLPAAPLFAAQAGRAGEQKPEEEIRLKADSMSVSSQGSQIEGQGNVEIQRDEMTIKADQVWLNRETQDMEATGKVVVDDPEWKIKQADRLRFNLGDETGTIENGDLFLEFAGQSYHIDEGVFTTCLCEDGPPTWKIAADTIDVSHEGEGRIRRGVFYIKDIPVLYIPFALFPVNTDRETGLLFPEFGSSSKSGLRYAQPYYWAINKSSDATLTFNVETKARIGFMGEYRTIFNKDAQAQIDVSYFNEFLRSNAGSAIGDRNIAECRPRADAAGNCNGVIPQNRWSVVGTHRQLAPSGWTTYSDVVLFSDDFFARELTRNLHFNYDQERDIKTSRYSQSRLGFLRGWGDTTLQGEWNYYQDFIQPDSRTLQRTPQIAYTGRQALWNTPLELRWRASGVNYIAQSAADGLRLDLRPELVLPFNLANYVHGSFNVAPRETLYHLYDNSTTFKSVTCPDPTLGSSCLPLNKKRSFTRNNSRELVEATGTVGTSFGRVYAWNGADLQKIRHVIEPEVGYLFVSRSKQNDIPLMDGVDRINHRNLATFSLTNRFWGKFSQLAPALPEDRDVEMLASPTEGDTRELGRLKFSINYDTAKERPVGGRLSDLDTNLRLSPKDYMAFGGGFGINPTSGHVSQATVLFSIFDPRPITRRVLDQDFMRPNSLDLSYRFIDQTANSPLADNANAVLVDPTSLRVCHSLKTTFGETFDPRCGKSNVLGLIGIRSLYHVTDHLLFLYDATYNARRGGFTTNRGSVKILSQCECWALTLALNYSTNPNELSFRFNFDLLGLSSQSKPTFK